MLVFWAGIHAPGSLPGPWTLRRRVRTAPFTRSATVAWARYVWPLKKSGRGYTRCLLFWTTGSAVESGVLHRDNGLQPTVLLGQRQWAAGSVEVSRCVPERGRHYRSDGGATAVV